VATLPRQLTEFVNRRCARLRRRGRCAADVSSHQELLAAFASSIEQAQSYLDSDDERASATWRLMAGGRELFAAPRAAVLRSFLFNHCITIVDKLLVYLRLLKYRYMVYGTHR